MAKKIAAPENVRPNLAWVYFKNNKAVATDSIKLMEVNFKANELETPKIKWLEKITDKQEIMIKSDDINFLKVPKTKTKQYNLIQIWNINNEVDWNTEVSLWTYDWNRENIINSRWIDGKFPEYEEFFNEDINFEVWVDIEHLQDLLNTYKAFWYRSIKLQFNSNYNLSPINIVNNKKEDNWIDEIKSILMPLKL